MVYLGVPLSILKKLKRYTMSKHITRRQEQVLEVIQNYIEQNSLAPTLAELKRILGISTKRGVVKHLEALEKKGYIYRTGGYRGINLVDREKEAMMSIPILGFGNAGAPLVFAEEDIIGSIQVDKDFIKSEDNHFALIIKGDSMNMRTVGKVPIADGNYVIVKKGVEVRDGDVVLAVIDNAATIKTFKKSSNSIILYPESNNPVHTPIYLKDDIEGFINGKVIAVFENPVNN